MTYSLIYFSIDIVPVDYSGGILEHPDRDKGALTIDQVQVGMTLYVFNPGRQFCATFFVEAVEMLRDIPALYDLHMTDEMHRITGMYKAYDTATGQYKGTYRRYVEAACNIGLEEGSQGGWSGFFCIDTATYKGRK